MYWTCVYLLVLMTFSSLSCVQVRTKVPLPCLDYQRAFGRSCYEFVDLQLSLFSAQAWCEQRGGHLAFIPDEETQHFLQRLLDPKKEVWLGLAPSASPNLTNPATHEGALSWLDGSHITYSNWVSSPQPGAACGHTLRDSDFQWEATRDCKKNLHFICQFDSGRSIVCAGENTTVQCGSGQVLMIDGGFYGRKNMYYCRSTQTTSTGHQCGWKDVVELLKAHCHGRQACNISELVGSFGESCPQVGSYLSVEHHCKDGLTLSVSAAAAVFEEVTISWKWLLDLPQGNPSCKLSTGDGRVIDHHSQEGLERSEAHKYTHPSTFVVAVECTSNDVHIRAQKTIAIQEPIKGFGVIRCYTGKLSFNAKNCKALHREPVQIQMEVKAGTHVTYRIQSDESVLHGLSVFKGNVPQNLTVTSEMMKQFGPGCHRLTVYASNMVTYPEVSTDLQMCVLEKVGGLRASVLTQGNAYGYSPGTTVGVSLERGAPVQLLFSLNGESYSEVREMNTSEDIFHFAHPFRGLFHVKLRAWNIFSSLEVDVFTFSGKNSAAKPNGHGYMRPRKKHRAVRSPMELKFLQLGGGNSIYILLLSTNIISSEEYEWKCKNPCGCIGIWKETTHIITQNCLPDPFNFNRYYFVQKDSQSKENTSICVTVTPELWPSWLSLTCTNGCNPITKNTDAKIEMKCDGRILCPSIVWYLEDQQDEKDWENETKECYKKAETRPLLREQVGGDKFTVPYETLKAAESEKRDVIVMIMSDGELLYKKYIIKTSSRNGGNSDSSDPRVTSPTATTAGPGSTTTGTRATTTKSTTATTAGPASTTTDTRATTTKPTTATTAGPTSTTTGTSATSTKSINATTAGPATTATGTSATTTKSTTATTAGPASTTTGTSATTAKSTTATTAGSYSTSPGSSDTPPNPNPTNSNCLSPTNNNFEGLNCSISPQSGTILDVFTIMCNTPCSNCRYCFKTDMAGHLLRCSNNNEIKSVFLPLGDSSFDYILTVTATAKNGNYVWSTTITAKVMDPCSPVDDIKASLENAVAQLKKQGLLSAETVGQLINSVSNKLNSQSDQANSADRQKLREKMLDILMNTVKEAPTLTPEEVQVIARALAAVIQMGTELSRCAQEKASLLFENLSSDLLCMKVIESEDTVIEIHAAVSAILEGVCRILDFSCNKIACDAALLTLSNTQSALLAFKDVDKAPTIIRERHLCVFVNRVTVGNLHKEIINTPNCSSMTFSLPALSKIGPSYEPVDVRMLTLEQNPFCWNKRGSISGKIGAVSLTREDGSIIPVENLSENIKILIPRPEGEKVKTSVLDLRDYSTTVIDIPSDDSTLVLKMVPSYDPLPLKLFLGYMDYPTKTNHVAMTEMPHQGETQEERYTWLLDAKDLKGNRGKHYLVVRPIVGPGIKSINASLSITSFTTACKFWNESTLEWSTFGCRVGVQTTPLVIQCLCNHLTFFGSSFFVTPNLVDPSRTAELFGTFGENPVVVCFVGALFLVYLLAIVLARRKDIKDIVKVKVTVLADNNPMDENGYLLSVSTGYRRGASTSSQVTITLLGAEGTSEPHHLTDQKKCVFERGAVDVFLLTTPFSLGDLQGIRLWHNNSGSHPAWFVGNVAVHDIQTDQTWHFQCNSWLAIDIGDGTVDKVVPVSTEMDMKRFSNLFYMKTTKDFSDGHLWYSVISRPPGSNFTCVQRVSCCFTLLLCTMLTSIMFYGIPTDPSEQTMDLGPFEFSWQQFIVGVQSSLIMFPVNILIVSIFRNTRRRETSCCKRKTKKPRARGKNYFLQTVTTNTRVDVSLDTIIEDITRIACSLSNNMKSKIQNMESGQGVDINAVLSMVEDFIKLNTIDSTQHQTQSSSNLAQPQPPEGSPGSTMEGIQKKSSKTQYLYRQLCHIDKRLSLLGPSGFPTPHSHSRALQQIQGIKECLEDQLSTVRCVNPDETTQNKRSPAESTDGADGQRKRGCCHGGLPWWFVFVGWLLVIACSFVSGFFTMLYGLKFGKDRSVSWLVSMCVSFFQSVLVIQPLKVLCLAVFFALIIKKVEDEDFRNVEFEGNLGDVKDQQMNKRDPSLYEPPPAADIEKMKRNTVMQQKAFALLKEILTYVGFMWMLLLLAHGQKDPNVFFLHRHIRDSFSSQTSDSMSLTDVFTWANTLLLSNLFGVYPGFITDGNSKLVGNARLRQLRVQSNSCQIAAPMLHFAPDCNAPYSWEAEDMGSYGTGWNRSERVDTSTGTSGPWTYQTQSELRSYPIWGQMVLYRGGGYVAELGPDSQNATSTLDYLFKNRWLDVYTRAIFVEFTVYNANVNLFCIVTLLLETSAVGAFQFHSELHSVRLYQSTDNLHIFVVAAEIIYLLFILYYMFLQGKLMKQQRWTYFRCKWNLLELTIILLSWSAVAVFVKRTLLGNRDMTYYENHKHQFASFYETATADSALQYLVAFLVLLATFKLWHLLRLNPKMNVITAALQRAWNDICSFLVVILIMFVAYSVSSNLIYGWKISSYKTFTDALLTIIGLQIGIFNYDEVLGDSPLLGGFLFGSCIVLMTFVVLNLLLSVILVAFKQEQLHHKPSDEEEIVDLMLKNICSLFGIRYEETNDVHTPDAKEDGGVNMNNSRNILNHTKVDF
uniref:Polycystic kidney disease 1 like 2a n=1 Tax=Gasterosteus aculeatus aculeatus TaxID=481459 RepID=A0AAQ4S7Y8_GASAC|nr:polycystic kidney disease protein 1-like 2 isoform X1 [Gasterosteus aculeatus aculeatus]